MTPLIALGLGIAAPAAGYALVPRDTTDLAGQPCDPDQRCDVRKTAVAGVGGLVVGAALIGYGLFTRNATATVGGVGVLAGAALLTRYLETLPPREAHGGSGKPIPPPLPPEGPALPPGSVVLISAAGGGCGAAQAVAYEYVVEGSEWTARGWLYRGHNTTHPDLVREWSADAIAAVCGVP